MKSVWVALLVVTACNGGDDAGAGGAGSISVGTAPPPVDPGCNGEAPTHAGEATYYDFADGSGNCGFPATPDDLMVGAMNQVDYAGSAACGACAEVTGPNGTITVRIVDRCPECPEGDIDLSPEAFERIAELSAGRVPITWHYTACDVAGPVVYHFKDGSNPFWVAIQMRNHTYAIESMTALDTDGGETSLARVEYNYFIADGGLGDGPYALRVTDVAGHVIEDTGIPLLDDADALGTSQFPVCSGP